MKRRLTVFRFGMRLGACLSFISAVVIAIQFNILYGLSVMFFPVVYLIIDSNPELVK